MKKGVFVHSGNAPTDSGWAELRKGCHFAIVKCGSRDPDVAMDRNLAGAKKHGFKTSILWYLDGRFDAKEQAITALKAIENVDPSMTLWVDFEVNKIYTPTYSQLKEFFGAFTAKSSRLLGIYTNENTWGTLAKNSAEFSAHPLWIAAWRSENNPPDPAKLFGGWKDWVIWQQADGKEGYPYTTEFCRDWYIQPTTQEMVDDLSRIRVEVERIKTEIITLADGLDALRSALGGVTTPPSVDCRTMPIYSQTDPHWATDPIGTTTIGRFGCLITCWAMILSKIEGRDVLPNEVAERLKSHGLLQSNGGVLYADLPKITTVPLETWEKTGGDSAELFEKANSADCINSFGAIGMRIAEWPGTHYVLSIGNGEIINPMGGVVQRVSDGTKSGGIFAAAVWSVT